MGCDIALNETMLQPVRHVWSKLSLQLIASVLYKMLSDVDEVISMYENENGD